jgi:Zn-dependent protease
MNRVASGVGLVGSGALLLWGKGKYILGALKLGKLASLGSMFVTIGTYSMFFGLPYAAGMVGLTLLHESGHALVMLNRGIPFSPMLFIPFVGATIAMKRRPEDAWEDALVAFGGPVLGSVGALGCSLGGYALDSQLLYALADFGYIINLFNLLPIGMMGKFKIMLEFVILLT